MAYIITKSRSRPKQQRSSGKSMVGTWSPEAQKQYRGVSPENKETFKVEKRVQELAKGGFNEAAISGMTGHSEGSVKKMMDKTGKNIHLDGKV